jgi:hypothetical protein
MMTLARVLVLAAAIGSIAGFAHAQSSYSGMQGRSIKALSDQQVADLQAGRGMGMAMPAELNGYPGPMHVLELADQLGLSADQRATIRGLFDSMKSEAIPLGERLIAQEAALDRLFAGRTATADNVAAATDEIGATQAKLRNAHLKYHLLTIALLQPGQIQRYGELRGYSGAAAPRHRHH